LLDFLPSLVSFSCTLTIHTIATFCFSSGHYFFLLNHASSTKVAIPSIDVPVKVIAVACGDSKAAPLPSLTIGASTIAAPTFLDSIHREFSSVHPPFNLG
jgi:hypothetical protein